MKRLFAAAVVASLVLAVAAVPARAGSVGLGVIAGEPTGVSLKTWLDGRHAMDAALGWSFAAHATLHLHADYLWHDFGLLRPSGVQGRVPVYYGIGGRITLRDDDNGPDGHDHDDLLGVRFPLGIAWIAATAPVDVFVELAPVLDLVPGTDLSLNAAIGVRYWFR
jgi:hypothetical protein